MRHPRRRRDRGSSASFRRVFAPARNVRDPAGAQRIGSSFFMDWTPIGGEKNWDGVEWPGRLAWPNGTVWKKLRGLPARDFSQEL